MKGKETNEKSRDKITVNCSTHQSAVGTKFHCDYKSSRSNYSNYPSGGSSHNGYSGGSNDGGSINYGKDKWGCPVKPYANSYGNSSDTRSSIDSSSASSTFKSIVAITSGAKHGQYLLGERIINLHKGSLTNEQVGVLMQHLQYQGLDLDKFDISYNKISNGAVESMFYTFSTQRSNTALYNIKFINLSNNQIGDDGAKLIASHISNGHYPNLKTLDVSGNEIGVKGRFELAKAVQKVDHPVMVLINRIFHIDTIIEGGKKQGDLFFGNKEEKQAVIKTYLTEAQSQGIDVKNVVVSKGIFEKIANSLKLKFDFSIGFTKCYAIPEDAASFATEQGIAKISKKAFALSAFTDAIACYFESFNETASSQPGVQFMLDAGIIDTSELLGNVE